MSDYKESYRHEEQNFGRSMKMNEVSIAKQLTLDDIISQFVEGLVFKIKAGIGNQPLNEAASMTMTVDELADTLGIAKPKAYELTNTEGFPSFKVGKRILVNRQGLQAWINRQCTEQIKGMNYFD